MRFLEVLCEGSSDAPAVREVLTRRFALVENEGFRIHAHRGKGKLPASDRSLHEPDPNRQGLLDQLPVKLRNMGKQSVGGYQVAVVVLVDADKDDCKILKQSLVDLYESLPTKPAHCLFRIAVEEIESWFLADHAAIKSAFPSANLAHIKKIDPDQVCDAWEQLAHCIGIEPATCGGGEKSNWARAIAPHLKLDKPKSPSLRVFISGVERILSTTPTAPTLAAQRPKGRVRRS